ncbi:malate permease [Campylobacterota bacterium]|nr:malate permease [Campylobacterota bacterium]
MEYFALIFICIFAGVAAQKFKLAPADGYKAVNAWVLYIAIPALALRYIPEINLSGDIFVPIISPFIVWGGAWIFVYIYDLKKRLDRSSRAALFVVCGLGNTGFIGFPMTLAYYGNEGLTVAVIYDQFTFIIFATIGVFTIMRNSQTAHDQANFYNVTKKIVRFPPFIASVTALVLPNIVDISFINPLLDKLVATMTPMALFSIGLQLKIGEIRSQAKLLGAGIFYKLVLAPALVFVFAFLMGAKGLTAQVSVLEAAMSSHITASLLASQHNLNPKYCSLVIGLGIAIGFFTSFVWYILSIAMF